jgi:HTH-type transcriptional regulator, fmd operon transcriptional regulator
MKGGLFNQKQLKILKLRARGFTQLETAKELGTTRANVSMIEWRARKKLDKARETIQAYEALQSSHTVSVEKGTKLAEVPLIVLHEGDKRHIHIRSDIVEIVRLVKALKPIPVRDGKTIRQLEFKINERGKLQISS